MDGTRGRHSVVVRHHEELRLFQLMHNGQFSRLPASA
jgi:hypothetical protein